MELDVSCTRLVRTQKHQAVWLTGRSTSHREGVLSLNISENVQAIDASFEQLRLHVHGLSFLPSSVTGNSYRLIDDILTRPLNTL